MVMGGEGRAGRRCQRGGRCYLPRPVGRVQLDMTGVPGLPAPLTPADVTAEFGPEWKIAEGHFCWTATRRPTPTAREIIVGQDLDHLAAKLRAEQDHG